MSIEEKLKAIAENQQKVYDAGVAAGQSQGGYGEGFAAGQQAEYDRFWDAAQQNGNRTNYNGFFAGGGWTADNIKPKYDVRPVGATYMFAYCGYDGDLDDIFANRGLTLDLSGCVNMNYLFYLAECTAVGVIDFSACKDTSLASIFNAPNLETIRLFIPPNVALTAANFNSSGALKNITFGGEITKSINFSRCPNLTAESVQSIIDHLADLTGQTAQTLTFHATVGEKLTDEQKATVTARNWTLVY